MGHPLKLTSMSKKRQPLDHENYSSVSQTRKDKRITYFIASHNYGLVTFNVCLVFFLSLSNR